jgi:S-adenosylmethionine hydrolase
MSSATITQIRPVVALLTDFGMADGYVGVMKGVIAGIIPNVQLIDITHEVPPQRIATGARILANSYRYFPAQTVFICVVDPGVGSSRGAIALHAGEWFFVGPDNGLFSAILAEETIHSVVELSNPAYHLPAVSSTFHGRDVFAPGAAHLAATGGAILTQLGPARDPSSLAQLSTMQVTRQGSRIAGQIVHVDAFGNLITNIPLHMVPELFSAAQVQITFPEQGVSVNKRRQFFAEGAEPAQPFIYGDSSQYIAIAVYNGNAARTLGVGYGTAFTYEEEL